MDGPEGKELNLVGVFDTNSEGRNPGNAQLLPLSPDQWRLASLPLLARHRRGRDLEPRRPGVDHLLLQPPAGPGDRRQDPRRHRRPGKGGAYVFKTPDDAVQVAKVLGQDDIAVDAMFADRKTTLKAHKDGRLVMEIERKKGDAEHKEPEGWLAKKTKWVRIFETTINDKKDDDLGLTEYDNLIRAIETPAKQFVGWVVYKGGEWVGHPAANVKMLLQSLGNAKDAAECIMGGGSRQGMAVGEPALPRRVPRRPAMEPGRRPIPLPAGGPGAGPDAATSRTGT